MRTAQLLGAVILYPLVHGCVDAHDRFPLDGLGANDFVQADGSHVVLRSLLGTRATLFLNLDPECPMTLGYAPMFDSLQHTLPEGVRMVGFYPAPFIVADSALRFARQHGFGFAQLMDPDCRLANALHAHVTPEAFLLGADGALLYRGAIDDSAVREGRKRSAVKHYLADALRALNAGSEVGVKEIPAFGCIVECGAAEEEGR